jgi:hypothetical protein
MINEFLGLLSFFAHMIMLILAPLIIPIAALFILLNIIKQGKQRTEALSRFAATAGLNFIGADSFNSFPGYQYFRIFNLGSGYGRQIENAIKGSVNGFQVSVFDYTYYVTFSTRKIRKQTVVVIDSPRLCLPLFSLQPKGKRSLFNTFGNGIDVSSNPSFSNKYLILGKDEIRIKQIFDKKAISHFDTIEGFTVEGGGSRILFYKDDMLAEPNQISWMINEAVKIASLFYH